ncbi:GGDEF domain-containing protein [Neobacillus sp. NPDC097160]|uniref:GGDEF domain-containing protein n=1 Tax=Neobacillus sp. NPDC097160 TaxID=3364298 RepID=UPI00381BA386
MDQKMNKWLNNPVYFRWGFFILLLMNAILYYYQIEQNHLYVFYILATVFLGIGFYKKPIWFLFIFTTVVVICRLLSGPEQFSILSDINNFKTINDNFGHKEGDNLLKVLSSQLEKSVQDTDIVARWGGDEFIILSKNNNTNETMGRIHQNLKMISTTYKEISVSAGTAIYPSDGKTLDDLLRVADKKMYNMKIRLKA